MASVKDTHGNLHKTEMCTWVTGKGRVLWEEPADMSLSVIPEKPSYKVGEHARSCQEPFPGSQALNHQSNATASSNTGSRSCPGNTPVMISKWSPILFGF